MIIIKYVHVCCQVSAEVFVLFFCNTTRKVAMRHGHTTTLIIYMPFFMYYYYCVDKIDTTLKKSCATTLSFLYMAFFMYYSSSSIIIMDKILDTHSKTL